MAMKVRENQASDCNCPDPNNPVCQREGLGAFYHCALLLCKPRAARNYSLVWGLLAPLAFIP